MNMQWSLYLLLFPALAGAQPLVDTPDFSMDWRGFGSVVATKTNDARVGWRVQNQPLGQAQEDASHWAVNNESILGVQADINEHHDLSGSVQVLATNRSHGYFEPAIELAFLRYKFNPQWQMRLGRIWTPSFMNSETRYIGYSNTTLRNTNYTLYQITNLNGADLQYAQPFASGTLNTAVYYGMNTYQLPNNAGKDDYYELPQIAGGYVAWEKGELLLRSSFTRIILERHGAATESISTVTVPALRSAYAGGTCPMCADEADRWERVRSGVQYNVFTLAGRYGWDNFTASAEYILRDTNSTFPRASGLNVDLAYTLGKWMPYTQLLTLKSLSNNQPVFPGSLPQFSSLNASYAAGKIDREILTLGLKYDLAKNVSMRAEAMQLWFHDPKAGVGFAPKAVGVTALPDSYRVYSLALDFLF